jgi:hypothetical protein
MATSGLNEIGVTGKSNIQGIGGNVSEVIKTENAMSMGKMLNAGMNESVEEKITGIFNSKIANFDSKNSSLAVLADITSELQNNFFNAVPMQMLPNKPGIGLINVK